MNKVKIAMVGAGGFARTYLITLWNMIDSEDYELMGIIDPYVSASTVYKEILERNIPLYNTMDEFYAEHTADLVCIASPVQFHKEQILNAFAHGSHVLCEKPLTVYAQDVAELEKASQESGLMLGVGFQWSFSRRNRMLKQHILEGRYGKVLGIKTCISWMRADQYYRSWHGHLYASDGSLLMDSVISNAMAHYLHFGLFLLGPTMDTARMPKSVKASLYRAKSIESFDTCSVQCEFEDGLTHNLYLTHAAISSRYLQIQIQFEHATASILSDDSDGKLLVTLEDGTVLNYDELAQERNVSHEKIDDMIQAVRHPENGVVCHAGTTLPFATVCNSLFAEVPIVDFAKEKVIHTEGEAPGEYIPDLFDQMYACFEQNKTPYELGYDWAVPDVHYELKTPEEYASMLKEKFL